MIEKQTSHTFILTIDKASLVSYRSMYGDDKTLAKVGLLMQELGFTQEDQNNLKITKEGLRIFKKVVA